VEHYELSEKGELIRLPDLYGLPEDDRPAHVIRVVKVDSDGAGAPGPRYLAYQRRIRASDSRTAA
jgi:hypothetical protein